MRQRWNFNGLILADDLGMKALRGTYTQRAENALQAGCDLVICSLSKIKAGMAGTVYNAQDANQLADAVLPPLNFTAHAYLQNMAPLPAPSPQTVAEAQARFKEISGDRFKL
jgi:beta-glucosidase-like glycosyl hydrolase